MWCFILDNLSFFAIVFSALFGGAIAIIGILKQRETAVIKNTIDFEAALGKDTTYDTKVAMVIQVGNEDKEGRTSVAYWAAKENFNEPETVAIRYVLNSWERAANGVTKKVLDSHFLYEMYGTHVLSLHTRLLPYINRIRAERQPKACAKFIAMAKQWQRWRDLEQKGGRRREQLDPKPAFSIILDATKFGGSDVKISELKDEVAKTLPEYTVQQITLARPPADHGILDVCIKLESVPSLSEENFNRAKKFIETSVLRVVMERHLDKKATRSN